MNPKIFRTGVFFAGSLDKLDLPADGYLLDMGTGTGVVAVFAAQFAATIDAVDVNPNAVRCARINVILNKLEGKVRVVRSDLFSALVQEYDAIFFNPPYLAGSPRNDFEKAFYSEEIIREFCLKVTAFLKPGGRLFLMLSTLADVKRIQEQFAQAGLPLQLLTEKHYLNETLLLFAARKIT